MSNTATPAPPPLELAPNPRLEPLRPMPLHEVKRAMTEYQEGLRALLDSTDWQKFLDRQGQEREFVKKPGWRKIAMWFGLDLLIDAERIVVDRDADGRIMRARVVGRVVAPNGRVGEDVAVCSIDERHFSKPEHDLVATAATRALNRATSGLVGMGDVSAEEVMDDVEPLLPDWAQAADDAFEGEMLEKLTSMFGAERAIALGAGIHGRYGYVPNVCAGLVRAIHRMWQASPGDPGQQGDSDAV
jgi:hypothetical protein